MKSILVLALLSIATLTSAQNQHKVYGPKAKNERVWINKSTKSEVVTIKNEKVTGGLAKNNQAWTKNYNRSATETVVLDEEKIALKGPNAKNYKPQHKNKKNSFDNLNQNLVQSKDSQRDKNNI